MTRYTYDNIKQVFVELPRHIYNTHDNKYEIRKKIHGKLTYWGRYNTLHKAINELQVCQYCNWDIDLIVENT